MVMKKRRPVLTVQMFSFLDAMVCTLGALLVLLHAFARHGQNEAVRKAETQATQQATEDPAAEREIVEWRTEQLREVRRKTEAQLADERLRLSHIEDHQRRLQDKLRELQIAAEELERLQLAKDDEQQRDEEDLEAARSRLAEARKAVDDARRRSRRAATYSVVPYEGPNSTHRRPVYVECRENSMVLQPEGVELTPADFVGMLGPGNPLASALRGVREYYAGQTAAGKSDAEPYPLLLVRPDGIKTYYAARSALDSWGSEFGYELIGADWKLDYARPDPKLEQLVRQIVAESRLRMRELAAATAQFTGRRPKRTLHASSSGGFVADRGSGGGGRGGPGRGGWDAMDSEWANGEAGGEGNGGGEPGGDSLSGGVGDASQGAGGAWSSTPNVDGTSLGGRGGAMQDPASGAGGYGARGSNSYSGGASGPGGASPYANPYDQSGGGAGTGQQGSAQSQTAGSSGGTGSQGQRGEAGETGNGKLGGPLGGSSPTASRDARSKVAGPGGPQATGSAAHGAGSGGAANAKSGSAASSAAGGASGSSGSSGDSSQSSSISVGSPQPDVAPGGPKKTHSLAKNRGSDWGLPDGGAGMSPASRPIAVECHNDRLVIRPDRANLPPVETKLGAEARDDMDEFVSNVWQHMKGWGIAGKGLYWRPTLLMTIEPGAADRYAEVKALLADSGLDVREQVPRGAQPPRAAKQPLQYPSGSTRGLRK